MNPIRSAFFPSRFRAAAALLVLLAATGEARAAKKVVAEVTTNARFVLYHTNGSNDGGFDPAASDKNLLDGNLESGFNGANNGEYFIADFSSFATNYETTVYVEKIVIGHPEEITYSLYVSTNTTDWTAVAVNARDSGMKTYEIQDRITAIKYVFVATTGNNDLAEFHVWGYRSSKPDKISNKNRAITFRDGAGHRGRYGFNGGSYSDGMFDGNFTSGLYQNGAGAELVVPTTALDPDTGDDTGTPWYVTEVKVGHVGNTKYSLYYTIDPEPTNILSFAKDPRAWTAIDGATGVQEAGTKTYLVNKTVTAVKYVFDTVLSWTASACEFEVRAMNPDDIPCMHDNLDLATAPWSVCKPATCTENAFEECFCPDCGKRFEREMPLSKLGHDFVATLTKVGRPDRYGSGYVTCARTIQDTNTLEVIWSCDYRIDFTTNDVDLTTLGGPPINGVVQYTDLTVSSIGAQDGGIKAEYLMDGYWDSGWGHAFYFETLSVNEYLQYAFGTTIELTKIEFSVLNEPQTVFLTKYDPATGEETILKTIPIKKIETFEDVEDPETGEITHVNTSPKYQRQTVDFFVSDKYKKTFVNAIRMRVDDYVDPETGEVIHYPGLHYGGSDIHTIVCEIHPWGTIQWAGPLTYPPTTIMILR